MVASFKYVQQEEIINYHLHKDKETTTAEVERKYGRSNKLTGKENMEGNEPRRRELEEAQEVRTLTSTCI